MPYSIKEIIDLAIGIEETGYEFYRSYGKLSKDTHMVDMFEFLAKEELAHKKSFQSLIDTKEVARGLFTEEYYLYLKAIGSNRVFENQIKNAASMPEGIASPMDALRKALVLEKDSILFYGEIKDLYADGSNPHKLILKIIAEERKHVMVLYDLSEKIKLT